MPLKSDEYKKYLAKARESLDVASMALDASKRTAAVVNSIHSAINAIDALSVYYLGRRHAGGHEGALSMLSGAMAGSDFRELSKQYGGLLGRKNEAEHQPDLMTPRQARDAVARAARILSWVEKKVP